MEERRFDELTRVLSAATSRRQVLKGVLGGVLGAVVGRAVEPVVADAAERCNPRVCEREVNQFFSTCSQRCTVTSGLFGGPTPRFKKLTCEMQCYVASRKLLKECQQSASGCIGREACCNQQCVWLPTDPNNCGACGHACPDGHACVDGHCQCDADQTYCGDHCVDTQTDNSNCGSCGHVCSSCETCLGGQCQPLDCGSGQVCCQHLCIPECQGGPPDPNTCLCDVCDGQANGLSCGPDKVCCDQHCTSEACPAGQTFDLGNCACKCTPITCPPDQTQDPITCQCVAICTNASDGTACGTNMECCQHQCVSNQCPSGKHFDVASCACVCDPVTCPSGTQDPNTCACTDICANVTCGICQTCDPASGTCVNEDNNTTCLGDFVCCNGSCQPDCTCSGLACPNGDCCPNSDDWACCDDGCCPTAALPGHGDGLAYCVAPGSRIPDDETGITWGGCCQPDQLMKLSTISESTGQCDCEGTDAQGVYCVGNMPTTYYGLTPCGCGPWLT